MGMNNIVKRVFFLLLVPFFCAFSIAKAEKIKYGKYIEYEGGVFKYQGEKLPFGKGTLSLLSYEKDSSLLLSKVISNQGLRMNPVDD
jgi:hypothetical protein